MSAQDNIDEANAEAEAAPIAAFFALLILTCCANAPKNVN